MYANTMKKSMNQRNSWLVVLGVIISGWVLLSWCTTTTPTTDEAERGQRTTGDVEKTVGEEETITQPTNDSDGVDLKTLIPNQSQLKWEGKRVLYTYNWLVDFKWWTLLFEKWRPVGGEFVIDMTAMSVANWSDWLLKHLSGEDFFAVEQYPEAKLFITKVTATDNPLRFDMTADMTIKGITNPVAFTATFNEDFTAATTQLTINRTLWNITFGSSNFFQSLWDKAIADEIPFAISVVLE